MPLNSRGVTATIPVILIFTFLVPFLCVVGNAVEIDAEQRACSLAVALNANEDPYQDMIASFNGKVSLLLAQNQLAATNILPADVHGDNRLERLALRGGGAGLIWYENPLRNPWSERIIRSSRTF